MPCFETSKLRTSWLWDAKESDVGKCRTLCSFPRTCCLPCSMPEPPLITVLLYSQQHSVCTINRRTTVHIIYRRRCLYSFCSAYAIVKSDTLLQGIYTRGLYRFRYTLRWAEARVPVHKEPARSLASRPVMPTNLKSVDRLIFHGLLALLPVIACTINVVDYKTEGFYSQGLSASLRCLGYLQSPLASHFVIIPETFTGPGCIHHSFRGPSRSLRCIPRTFEYLANPSSNLTEPYMRYNKTYGSRRAMQGNSN